MYPLHLQTVNLPNGPLQLYVPDRQETERLYKISKASEPELAFPFWAKIWPASIAMASFLQTHPQWIANKVVAEFAAGLGLPSLAIAPLAKSIWCSDYEKQAVAAIEASKALNGYQQLSTAVCNWNNFKACGAADVVLMSDVNYEPAVFGELELFLNYFLSNQTTVILTTPQRLMAKPFLEKILPFAVLQTELEVGIESTRISLYVLEGKGGLVN